MLDINKLRGKILWILAVRCKTDMDNEQASLNNEKYEIIFKEQADILQHKIKRKEARTGTI